MIVTHMNADATAVIPAEVLESLGVRPGDQIGFEIIDGEVSVFRYPADDEIDEDTGLSHGELRAMIKEADDDPRPTIPAEEAFARAFARIKQVRRRRDAA